MKSLDRDIFDAEPMRELSGRRPLVYTEFQCQKVVLKVMDAWSVFGVNAGPSYHDLPVNARIMKRMSKT